MKENLGNFLWRVICIWEDKPYLLIGVFANLVTILLATLWLIYSLDRC